VHQPSEGESYERGWSSDFTAVRRRKYVSVRRVQIFVIKLAANFSVFAVGKCAALPL
jgi:hypothetical protein